MIKPSAPLKLPALDPATVAVRRGTSYPADLAEPCALRVKRALGNALGLKNFGVNLTELPPGTWSALRHWHTHEDEFVYIVKGEVILITDVGEQTLCAGMAAGFPAGVADGHHLVNRSSETAIYLEVGDRRDAEDDCFYPDVDLQILHQDGVFTRKDGRPA
jgi:uncharacterized cupin superfamily protein